MFSLISSCCTSCSSSSLLPPPILKDFTINFTSPPAQTGTWINCRATISTPHRMFLQSIQSLNKRQSAGADETFGRESNTVPKTHTRNCIWSTWSHGTFQCHHGEVGWNYCSYSPMTAKNLWFPGPWCLRAWYKPVFLIFRDYCDLNAVSSLPMLSPVASIKHDERGWLFLTGSVKICGR